MSCRRRGALALVLALLLGLAVTVAGPAPAGARPDAVAQTSPTEPPPSTENDLLNGSTTVPPSTTTTTIAADDGSSGSSDGTLWLIVAGLVLVAILLAVFTGFYWHRTRPDRPNGEGDRRPSRFRVPSLAGGAQPPAPKAAAKAKPSPRPQSPRGPTAPRRVRHRPASERTRR